ncbi:MAG: hypothetical protein IPL27_01260 [Lewinellaceae bacterium]|nr:hypothetical protein [Lewinellaceae bacterium]
MKTLLFLPVFLLLGVVSSAQTINPNYDSTLAKTFGADDYGMKMYVLVILKTGSNTVENKAVRDSLFAGHMQNIGRLVDMGKLIVAGPLGKNDKTYRGIFILNVTTFEEANQLMEADPAIKEKLLEPELYNWYGSAALSDYLKTSDKIWKFNH